jgi:hypothetical protein
MATSNKSLEDLMAASSINIPVQDLKITLECQVCLSTPKSGPLYICSTGCKFVCSDCQLRCPFIRHIFFIFFGLLLEYSNPSRVVHNYVVVVVERGWSGANEHYTQYRDVNRNLLTSKGQISIYMDQNLFLISFN